MTRSLVRRWEARATSGGLEAWLDQVHTRGMADCDTHATHHVVVLTEGTR